MVKMGGIVCLLSVPASTVLEIGGLCHDLIAQYKHRQILNVSPMVRENSEENHTVIVIE